MMGNTQLLIVDPLNPEKNNIGRASYQFEASIQPAMYAAYITIRDGAEAKAVAESVFRVKE